MKDNWIKKFDETDWDYYVNPVGTKIFGTDVYYNKEQVKSFIQNLLKEQKAELIEEIEEKLPKEKLDYGFNSCLFEVKELLEALDNPRA